MPRSDHSLARRLVSACFLVLSLPAFCQAQDKGLTARTLYYNSGSDNEQAAAPKKKPSGKSATTAPKEPPNSGFVDLSSAPPAVTHLGVRYNVMLMDPDTRAERAVDPGGAFRANDCLSLSVQANYDGYLYIIDHGSSGKWDVMLPSSEMPAESNFIKARIATKAPAEHCFSVNDPPGLEHLFVVFARNPQDVSQLNSAIKSSQLQQSPAEVAPASNAAPANSGAIGEEIARLQEHLQSRDLIIKKVTKPMDAQEPADSVYVVNVSNTPSDQIVTEIPIRHN